MPSTTIEPFLRVELRLRVDVIDPILVRLKFLGRPPKAGGSFVAGFRLRPVFAKTVVSATSQTSILCQIVCELGSCEEELRPLEDLSNATRTSHRSCETGDGAQRTQERCEGMP